ncbi:right-handed parallel beta-helix repeat-containing protein [Planctomycetota bacterium]
MKKKEKTIIQNTGDRKQDIRATRLHLLVIFVCLVFVGLANGDIITVDDDGPADFNNIQAAINDSNDGDIVEVQQGIYTGDGNRDIDFMGKAITIRGTEPNNPDVVATTIIDCNGTEAEPHRGFYFHNGEDGNSVLAGLTITNGYAPVRIIDDYYEFRVGGGIYCDDSSPTITNCRIIGNYAGGEGGGIGCEYSNSMITNCEISNNIGEWGGGIVCGWGSPIIVNCEITGNSGVYGGGIFYGSSNLTINNCRIIANSAVDNGGGISYQNSNSVITNCEISNNLSNWGGGISSDNGNSIIVNCKINNNISRGSGWQWQGDGGGIHSSSNDGVYLISNSVISGNISWGQGGGIYSYGGGIMISNCTITGNRTVNNDPYYEAGDGIFFLNSKLVITNSIVWGNGDSEIWAEMIIRPPLYFFETVSYNNIKGGYQTPSPGYQGIGNIDVDPCFVDPGYWDANGTPEDVNDDFWVDGDYHLKSQGWYWDGQRQRWDYDDVTSRCIDAGNPGSPLGDELLSVPDDPNNDWGENLRINMGAYGGTAEASMGPYDWALLGDLTNDGTIDYTDLAGQMQDWLTTASEQPGDLNRDGIVNMADFALLATDWLAKTSWYEPPIVLEIYSDGWGTLLDTITMREEGEITISVEEENPYGDPPRYYIYASRQGYSTEVYYCEKGDTIDVDLDKIIPGNFNGVIFMTQTWFSDIYLENTDVNVLDGNTPGSTVVYQFQTDEQGRFAIDPLPPGTYYFEFMFDELYLEEVDIQGQYQDFFFPAPIMVLKPNIYMYPEETADMDVDIVFPHGGRVIASNPEYGNGWHVTVEPNGIIDGQYDFLFYESLQPDYGQYEAGWVVAQEQLEDFFRNNMVLTGFNQKEIDDFIEYWIPRLTEYPCYAIYPQYNDELEEMIRLEFSEQPANLIRLIYSVRGLETNNLSLQEPVVPPFSREDFTVTEWGVILK